tara:strand:+ start:2242 stop:2406 length:165 start_codon:yes stop_codon:yes gene_type:complete
MKLKIITENYLGKPMFKGELVTKSGGRYVARSLNRQTVIASLREQSEQKEGKKS